jgi:hypothetical protein
MCLGPKGMQPLALETLQQILKPQLQQQLLTKCSIDRHGQATGSTLVDFIGLPLMLGIGLHKLADLLNLNLFKHGLYTIAGLCIF